MKVTIFDWLTGRTHVQTVEATGHGIDRASGAMVSAFALIFKFPPCEVRLLEHGVTSTTKFYASGMTVEVSPC
jgi:hypothetical protein